MNVLDFDRPPWWFTCELGDKFVVDGVRHRIVYEPWPVTGRHLITDSTVGAGIIRWSPAELVNVELEP